MTFVVQQTQSQAGTDLDVKLPRRLATVCNGLVQVASGMVRVLHAHLGGFGIWFNSTMLVVHEYASIDNCPGFYLLHLHL